MPCFSLENILSSTSHRLQSPPLLHYLMGEGAGGVRFTREFNIEFRTRLLTLGGPPFTRAYPLRRRITTGTASASAPATAANGRSARGASSNNGVNMLILPLRANS